MPCTAQHIENIQRQRQRLYKLNSGTMKKEKTQKFSENKNRLFTNVCHRSKTQPPIKLDQKHNH